MTGTPTPPVLNVTTGFDIIMTKGTSRIVVPDPPDEDDGEIPPYTPTWDSVQLDITGGEPVLNGYRYAMQAWNIVESTTTDPDTGEDTSTFTKTFPVWTLVSQTITKLSPTRQVFFTNTGNELFPTQGPITGSLIGSGGITDGTKYSYLLVFDQAELEWLPRCSTTKQPFVTKKTPPDDIIQPDLPFPKYPMDTISAVVPDPRESVTISYQVDTVYQDAIGTPGTFSFIIEQNCVQNPEITAEKMQALLDKCYFTHGYYHMQLYDVKAPPNYDEYGDPIGPVVEPIYLVDEEATELVGFDVLELQNSVWVLNDIDKIPEEEAASEIVLKDTVAEGQEQIKGLEGIMETTQKDYEDEIASIEKVQQENADVVSVNEERKTQLLGNIKNMITGAE